VKEEEEIKKCEVEEITMLDRILVEKYYTK
jgi:hypothetical protein